MCTKILSSLLPERTISEIPDTQLDELPEGSPISQETINTQEILQQLSDVEVQLNLKKPLKTYNTRKRYGKRYGKKN